METMLGVNRQGSSIDDYNLYTKSCDLKLIQTKKTSEHSQTLCCDVYLIPLLGSETNKKV